MDPASRHYVVVDRFFAHAAALRAALDRRLSDRADPFDPSRFAWEYWHVPSQFSQHRTPARAFFPSAAIARFEGRLLRWASAQLGLSELGGPPWLSAITDGGFQALHRDTPNGQFAFSYGLSRARPGFRGGETLLARPDLLDYFRTKSHRADASHLPMFDEIASRFDRLVAFDSRIPHAVRAVEGSRHPREGRIALQGWLCARGCVVEGELARDAADAAVARALRAVSKRRRALVGADGLFSVRLDVASTGRVRRATTLVSTLVATEARDDAPARIEAALEAALRGVRFPAVTGGARVIAPVLVEDGAARVPPRAG